MDSGNWRSKYPRNHGIIHRTTPKRYGAGVSAVEALRGVSLEVRAIADRILFLDDGLIVQEFGKSDQRRVLTVMEELGR